MKRHRDESGELALISVKVSSKEDGLASHASEPVQGKLSSMLGQKDL